MSTVTVYVAGPMTGLPDFNYPAFNEAAHQLTAAGYTALNPTSIEDLNETGDPQEWPWYMRHAIRMVIEADGLALLPGWRTSRGAKLEVTIARALELPIRTLDAWLAHPLTRVGES